VRGTGGSEGDRVEVARQVDGDISMRPRCADRWRVGCELVGNRGGCRTSWCYGATAFITGLCEQRGCSSGRRADVVEAGAALHRGSLILPEQAESFSDSGRKEKQRCNENGNEFEQVFHVAESEYLPFISNNL